MYHAVSFQSVCMKRIFSPYEKEKAAVQLFCLLWQRLESLGRAQLRVPDLLPTYIFRLIRNTSGLMFAVVHRTIVATQKTCRTVFILTELINALARFEAVMRIKVYTHNK